MKSYYNDYFWRAIGLGYSLQPLIGCLQLGPAHCIEKPDMAARTAGVRLHQLHQENVPG